MPATPPPIRGFALVFTVIGALYVVLASSMIVRGSAALVEFGVAPELAAEPVLADFFGFFYQLMAFVGVLTIRGRPRDERAPQANADGRALLRCEHVVGASRPGDLGQRARQPALSRRSDAGVRRDRRRLCAGLRCARGARVDDANEVTHSEQSHSAAQSGSPSGQLVQSKQASGSAASSSASALAELGSAAAHMSSQSFSCGQPDTEFS